MWRQKACEQLCNRFRHPNITSRNTHMDTYGILDASSWQLVLLKRTRTVLSCAAPRPWKNGDGNFHCGRTAVACSINLASDLEGISTWQRKGQAVNEWLTLMLTLLMMVHSHLLTLTYINIHWLTFAFTNISIASQKGPIVNPLVWAFSLTWNTNL